MEWLMYYLCDSNTLNSVDECKVQWKKIKDCDVESLIANNQSHGWNTYTVY